MRTGPAIAAAGAAGIRKAPDPQLAAQGPAACPKGRAADVLPPQRARAGRVGVLRVRASRAVTATVDVGGIRRRARLRAGLNRVRLPALPPGRYALTVTGEEATRRATLVLR